MKKILILLLFFCSPLMASGLKNAEIDFLNYLIIKQGEAMVVPVSEASIGDSLTAFLTKDSAKKELSVVSDSGRHFVVLAVDLYQEPGSYFLNIYQKNTDSLIAQKPVLVEKGVFPKHVSKIWNNSKKFTPKKLKIIWAQKAELAKAFQNGEAEPMWFSGFALPVDSTDSTGVITHQFGEIRINPKTHRSRFHRGTDIRAPLGCQIKTIADGKVALTGDDYIFEGNVTVIDHGAGVYSLYLHQSKFLVAAGDSVKKGQVIGLAGSTGNSIGAHLHLAVKIKGAAVDPIKVIDNLKIPAVN